MRDAKINGSAPDSASIALLIVDMLSDFASAELAPWRSDALRAANRIALLRRRARAADIPVIYVNDNSGRWRSNASMLVERMSKSRTGRAIIDLIAPSVDDYVLLKPKHSIFFVTPLETLLQYIGVRALILTGVTSTQCILFSAVDAYVRDYSLYVPSDCIASAKRKDASVSKYLFKTWLAADTRTSDKLRVPTLRRRHGRAKSQ